MIRNALFQSLVSCCFIGFSFGQLGLSAAPPKERSHTRVRSAKKEPLQKKKVIIPKPAEKPREFLQIDERTDYLPIFTRLFDQVAIERMLEFGLGMGTKFFLDRVKHLTSVEIIVGEQTPDSFLSNKKLYEGYRSWSPVLYHASAHCDWANHTVIEGQNPALYDATYLLELRKLVFSLTEEDSYELVFVDPRIHNRGDLITPLFDRVDIIVAHDTNHTLYQWDRIYTPSNYEKIVFTEGQGVTFWVKKERTDVIKALTGSPNVTASKQNLRIFFPHVHAGLELMFLRALQFLGHTRLYPGCSFDQPESPYHIRCLKGTTAKALSVLPEDVKQSVDVVEIEDLFRNPPDIIFISCPENEKDVLNLYNAVRKTNKHVKLAYYSGNNYAQPVYNVNYCHNIITLDVISESFFKDQHHVCWIPWVNCDEFAQPVKTFELGSYLQLHYLTWAKEGEKIYNEIQMQCKKSHPNLPFSNVGSISHSAATQKMRESLATLHIKDSEGFGCTIAESLAVGRPVFLYRPFCLGNRLMNWCIEGKTAFFFDTYEEFAEKFDIFLKNPNAHQECLETFKFLIDNEQNARVLQNFFDHLL